MPTPSARAGRRTRRTSRKPAQLSRTTKPAHMSLHQWQTELRRQFAREAPLEVRNLGGEPVFSEFAVTNPASQRTYRVAIRGEGPGINFCACPDYAVNTLGTCKHVEAVLHRLRRRHKRALREGHHPAYSEVYVQYGPQRRIMFAPGTECPPGLRGLAAKHFDAEGVLQPDAALGFDDFLSSAAKIDTDLRVYDDALALIAELRDARTRRECLRKRYEGNGAADVWKKLLKVPLHPYQQEGALFAAKAGRAILADDMGLGKTIQAIAAAEILAREFGVERTLVVCPASLKSQWKHEIEQFSDRPALIIEGLTHQRKAFYEQDGPFFKIVNYDVLHRDLNAIAAWAPDLIVLDEAQRIKNWQTRAARTVKRLDSRYALVLTGTPLENRIEELHSIVEVIDRHRLGPLFAFKAAHEVHAPDSARVVGYQDLNRISTTLAPILIRRTKQEVLRQLPPRMDKNFFVPMTDPQWVPHDENRETVARLVAKWHRHRFLTESDQLRLRIALQNMRMSCDSTYLIDHETKHGTKVDELAILLEEIFEEPGAKAVIFSQWVRMNELVAEMLAHRGWGHVHLHGGVPSRQRNDLVHALREDDGCRVFLSTDAGGVGLNLQTAATVINMDLPWNPAILEQRIGRVHRMGQRNPVRVVNFVSEGTIEQGMLSLLAFKKNMFAGVLDGATDKVLMGDSALNRFMKTVETATSSVPQVAPTPVDEPDMADVDADMDQPSRTGVTTPEARFADGATGKTPVPHPSAGGAPELTDVLTRGLNVLYDLGRALNLPGTPAASDARDALAARIETDAGTHRRELRLTLPDDDTLRVLAAQLSSVFSAFVKQ